MGKVERAALAFVAALAAIAACDSSVGGSGGETHWLDDCDSDDDCGGRSLTCLCGVCTRGCQSDGDCRAGARAATCFTTASPGVVRRCGVGVTAESPGICLNVCNSDADCRAGDTCASGKCVAAVSEAGAMPPEPVEPSPESGAPPPGARTPTPNDTAGKYTGVDAGVDIETPIVLPEPRRNILGLDDPRVLGTWEEIEADGSPCRTSRLAAFSPGGGVCARLTLEAYQVPGVVGTITWRSPDEGYSQGYPMGPFDPPTDATSGYPVGVDPADYTSLTAPVAGVTYPLLDGLSSGRRFTFWYSLMEVWRDWCKMRDAFPYDVGGRTAYRCVPADANEANTDLGVLALCTTAWDVGYCSGIRGCSCPDGATPALCKQKAMCNCTDQGCTVAAGAESARVDIDVDLDAGLMNVIRTVRGGEQPFVMKKVTQ